MGEYEVIVIDGGSTDQTCDITNIYGLQTKSSNDRGQFNIPATGKKLLITLYPAGFVPSLPHRTRSPIPLIEIISITAADNSGSSRASLKNASTR